MFLFIYLIIKNIGIVSKDINKVLLFKIIYIVVDNGYNKLNNNMNNNT
jgi:hypothetical protein